MRYLTATLILLLITASTLADTWLGGDLRMSYAGQRFDMPFAKPKAGISPETGFTIEVQHRHFLFSTGLTLGYAMRNIAVEDREFNYLMLDTEGVEFIYTGQVTGRRDKSHNLNVNIPLLFGAELSRHVHLLAGARIRLAVSGSTRQSAYLATVGDYDRYYDLLHDMPNHGFHSKQKTISSNSITERTDVSLYGEIGYWWHLRQATYGSTAIKFRIAAYAEYGLLDTRANKQLGLLNDVDTSHYMDISMNYAPNSTEAAAPKINNYNIGIRFAILFRIHQSPRCNCSY